MGVDPTASPLMGRGTNNLQEGFTFQTAQMCFWLFLQISTVPQIQLLCSLIYLYVA